METSDNSALRDSKIPKVGQFILIPRASFTRVCREIMDDLYTRLFGELCTSAKEYIAKEIKEGIIEARAKFCKKTSLFL